MEFRLAEQRDDGQLTHLVAKPMPGQLSLSMRREPSYWDSLALAGPPRKALVATLGDDILALCSFFPWTYSVAGQHLRIWTVSDFRAADHAAHRGITGRGWKALREQVNREPAVMSLVDDNPLSFRLFSKARPGWPRLRPLAQLQTLIFPLAILRQGWRTCGLVRPNPQTIVAHLNQNSPDYAPIFESRHLGQVTPDWQQFVGVFDGTSLQACGALWDLTPVRQVKVAAYRGLYDRLYRLGLLPKPGSSVSVAFASFLGGCCRLSQRQVAVELARLAKDNGTSFLIWGGDHKAPCPFPQYWPRLTYRSTLYQLHWDGDCFLPLPSGPVGFPVPWL